MRHLRYTDLGCTVSEFVVLLLFAGYFLFYGLIPIFGGDQLGLVGADEPRYAQIAREMLAAHSADCHAVHARIVPRSLRPADLHASYVCLMGGTVTPILYGKPWLEKPALYYWRAMGFYKELGVYDWIASAHSPGLPASQTLSPGRTPGRRTHHGLRDRDVRFFPRCLHGHAARRSVLHRHAWLVRLV